MTAGADCGFNRILMPQNESEAMLTEGGIAFRCVSSTIPSLCTIWSGGLSFASAFLVEQHRFDEVRHGPVLFLGGLLDKAEKLRKASRSILDMVSPSWNFGGNCWIIVA